MLRATTAWRNSGEAVPCPPPSGLMRCIGRRSAARTRRRHPRQGGLEAMPRSCKPSRTIGFWFSYSCECDWASIATNPLGCFFKTVGVADSFRWSCGRRRDLSGLGARCAGTAPWSGASTNDLAPPNQAAPTSGARPKQPLASRRIARGPAGGVSCSAQPSSCSARRVSPSSAVRRIARL
jgi:hypothetical protein